MSEMFGKKRSPATFLLLGGPAGGSVLERASPPNGRGKISREEVLYFEQKGGGGAPTTVALNCGS